MKKQRHLKILQMLTSKKIETQEQLAAQLQKSGFNVTQATVSRDIKELKLIKKASNEGKYYYSIPETAAARPGTGIRNIFKSAVISAAAAGNLVVLKCYTGTAQAACASIDSEFGEEVIGTIAGDDTIFIAMKDATAAEAFADKFKDLPV